MTHGTNSTYTRGCRCTDCKKGHADWQRDYFDRRIAKRLEAFGLTNAPCAWCGDTESPKDFDHVNPNAHISKRAFSQLLESGSDEAVRAELPLVHVLCSVRSQNGCHARKQSLWLYEGQIVALSDSGAWRAHHPARKHGQFVGWTCDPEMTSVTANIIGLLQLANERLKREAAAAAA
jgi:hypothetical protein